jgi:hypothetical protein
MPLDQHWVSYPDLWPAFAASAVEGKGLVQNWKWLHWLQTKAALRHNDVRRIGAFDEWVDNRDRHVGNLIRRHDGAYVAIDNEFALFSAVWAVIMPQLTVAHRSLVAEAANKLTHSGLTRFKVDMALASDHHAAALSKVQQRIVDTIAALVPDKKVASQIAANVVSFLQARADQQWMRQHLGVIA